jgi:hypothetical protein
MSQIDDLRKEAQEWRTAVSNQSDIARMLDKAADTIEALAKMCKRAEFVPTDQYSEDHCPWCGAFDFAGHKPSCEWITNGVAALLGEETE